MKALFILLLPVFLFGQNFEMMKKHLDKMESKCELYSKAEMSISDYYKSREDSWLIVLDSSITSEDTIIVYNKANNYELKEAFLKIYKKEYLRYVAREMLKAQFEKEPDADTDYLNMLDKEYEERLKRRAFLDSMRTQEIKDILKDD